MSEDEIKFEDADAYSVGYNKDKITFRDIILQHVRKITTLASVEFRGGYWEVRPNPNPMSNVDVRIYIPDSREVYSNAIEVLADLLTPYFDNEMKEAEKKAIEEDTKAFENNTISKQPEREDKNPEESEQYERRFGDIENRISYRSQRVKINRRLFRAISCFLYRKRYLELGEIED